MEQLKSKTFKINAEIITPIHIDNNKIYDRLDYFIFEWWDEIQIVDRKWLYDCASKDINLFNQIISSIEKQDFVELENLKIDFYEKYFDSKKYLIKEIKVWSQSLKYLILGWNNNNIWEVKQFSKFWIKKEITIPWSTLKGIFRTMFLFQELNKLEKEDYKKQSNKLEAIDKAPSNKLFFSFIEFSDVKVNNYDLKIDKIISNNKPKKKWNTPQRWPDQILELLVKWNFEIEIKDLKWVLSKEILENLIKNYSTDIVAREEQILEHIWIWLKTNLIDNLDNYINDWKYPIKIWMFKKSLAYKIFWEDMIEDLNKIQWKDWLEQARKLWIWDKTLYTDENNTPVWWITLSNIKEN